MLERIFSLGCVLLILTVNGTNFTHKNVQSTEAIQLASHEEAIVLETQLQSEETVALETQIQIEDLTVLETQTQDEEPTVLETKPTYVERFTEVPLFFQTDYPNTRYGHATVATHGCGITSLSMVLTYLLDEEVMPDTLAQKYGRYNGKYGSDWMLFPNSAADYGVTIEKQTWKWEEVVEALKEGKVCIANAHKESVFTNGGHFIVYYGITDDGKVLVRDPNKYNYGEWSSPILKEGFANGFEEKSLKYHCFPVWIYEKKDVEALAEKYEQTTEMTENLGDT